MSFDINYWGDSSVTSNSDAGHMYIYTSSADALATIVASAYFNDVIRRLEVGNIIYIRASDGAALVKVTSVTTNVTTSIILNADVSHRVVFAGEHTTAGGAAAEAITVTGALATDLAIATVHTVGASPQVIVTTVASADTVTVTFAADPSTDHVVTYVVYRAM